MGRTHDVIDDRLKRRLEAQPVFFVATAPLGDDGHVNVSPKGYDSFRVLGPTTVAYLDLTGSGAETVARLQRAVRPNAGYARSLAVLARAKAAGLVTKSGLIVGMGETDDEVLAALADLRGVGVDIVTIGQYLRPSVAHLPVARWVDPATFETYRAAGRALGIGHVEASPLTRSSYHAREAAATHDLARS